MLVRAVVAWVVLGAAVATAQGPDLAAAALELLDPASGARLTRSAFGKTVRARVAVSNLGSDAALDVSVALLVSDDASFSLLGDTWVCHEVVPSIPAGAMPVMVTLDCPLPEVSGAGVPFTSGDYHLLALADATGALVEADEVNNGARLGPFPLAAPGPDLLVPMVLAPSVAGAGEAVLIERVLRNEGGRDAPSTPYRYVASRDPQVSPDDEPLALLDGGTAVTPGAVQLTAGQGETATDLVQLPATLAPGTWFIGCVVDATGLLTEEDEQNNARTSAPVTVVAAGLRVAGDQLPGAVEGRPYAFRLAAQGAQGPLTWSLVAGSGQLPLGFQLAADGLVAGTPTSAGASAFSVRVTDGVTETTARLALQVMSPLAPLEVLTEALPPVQAGPGATYAAALAAIGGRPPYAWRVVGGTLPAWLSLSAEGTLAGAVPTTLAAQVLRVTLEVEDAHQARARREFALALEPSPGFSLRTAWLEDAVVGQPWSHAVVVENADGSPVATPLRFVLSGALPEGVAFEANDDGAAFLGTPAAAGDFPLRLGVEDALGRRSEAHYVLRVHPARTQVRVVGLPPRVSPGEELSFRFLLATQRVASWRLVAGALPAGLALGADGVVSGRLAADEPSGRWDLVVEGIDARGFAGLGAVTLLVEPAPAGCSGSGTSLGPGVLGLLLLGFARAGRRRAAMGTLTVLGLVALPAVAQPTGYQVSGPVAASYEPLTGGAAVTPGSWLELPFPVRLAGTTYTSVAMSQFGYLAFTGSSTAASANQGIPFVSTSTFQPRTFLAPWWDALHPALAYRTRVTGQAPHRVVAFEWDGAGANTPTPRISFQVEVSEGSGRLRFRYSPDVPLSASASVGVQLAPGSGTPGLFCATTASCTAPQYPAGQVLEFAPPEDLLVDEVGVPLVLHAGATVPLSARVVNAGGRDVVGAVVRFVLSADAVLDASDAVLGSAAGASVTGPGDARVLALGTVPAGAAPGAAWVLAQVDPDGVLLESAETNNVSAPVAITVAPAAPDVAPGGVQSPSAATPGATLMVSRTIENVGSASMPASRVTWLLSSNAAVSVADRPLGSARLVATLGVGAVDTLTETVVLPADLAPGAYWLGVCANYDPAALPAFGIEEVSLLNNCATASAATVVTGGPLGVVTASLLAATALVPYGAWLTAQGGSGDYAWTATAPLPRGLELSSAGELRGTPVEAGRFVVAVRVTSGSATASATLELEVRDEAPLRVVSGSLPPAREGEAYVALLAASGGQGPLAWSLASGAVLPGGLVLASDGAVTGRPTQPGRFAFGVEVRDAQAALATAEVELLVLGDATLRFIDRRLPPAVLGQAWSAPLEVAGGAPPYRVRVVRLQELPLDATDEPGVPVSEGAVLEPLGLAQEPGTPARLAGTPRRVGRFALRFEVTDAAGASAGAEEELLVTAAEPLVITTEALPDARAEVMYEARVAASVPGVEFSLPCVRHAESASVYACVALESGARLPPDLVLLGNGTIAGRPLDLGATSPATYTFLVKATATDGRRAVKALSITVRPKASGGCSTAGLGAWAGAALALAVRRRRRGGCDLE